MAAEICRKTSGGLPGTGPGSEVSVTGELGLLVSEPSGSTRIRQRIIQLYDELRPPLQAYLCCLGMSTDQAEDVIQETFLRLVRSRFDRNADDNLRAWVFRVAHNLSMDVHRFQRRWSQGEEDEEPHRAIRRRADPAPSPEQQVMLEERMRNFETAFAQLTPKQRQCVLLRAEGFRYREIALTLGVSVQRVGELMQRSISLLEVHTS
jgi:RNA polymerase sigma-70 factor, ECF subfamily